MHFIKFSLSLALFATALWSSAYAMKPLEDNSKDHKWIPQKFEEMRGTIISLIEEEDRTQPKKNNNTDAKQEIFRGYSFPGMNPVRELCLLKISERFTSIGIRPDVLDAGAGQGLMSWKMVVAGGLVTAIEQQENQKIHSALLYIFSFFPDESFTELGQVCIGDICDNTLNAYKPDLFDVTWTGHVLHFLTPDQTLSYVKNLYNVTKPGGYAYATDIAPTNLLQADSFLERKNKKELYPGYFIVHYNNKYIYDATNKKNDLVSIDAIGPCRPAPADMSPSQPHDGMYKGKKVSHNFDKPLKGDIFFHQAAHLFDPDSLGYFFKEAGFELERAFWYDDKGILNETPSKEMFKNYAVGIIARKPERPEDAK